VRTVLWWGHLKERVHFEEIGIDGRIILTWILNKYYWEGGVDWIYLAQDRGQMTGSRERGDRGCHQLRGLS
jgi:hypothetical protein